MKVKLVNAGAIFYKGQVYKKGDVFEVKEIGNLKELVEEVSKKVVKEKTLEEASPEKESKKKG